MDVLILVVLYNKDLYNSETLLSLKDCEFPFNASLIVWDNSKESNITTPQLKLLNKNLTSTLLIHKGVNYGLSYIYNKIINDNATKFDFFIFLDHDTILSQKYIDDIFYSAKKYPEILLHLPRIYSNNKIVSPALQFYFIGKYKSLVEPGKIKTKNLTAINSGMVINTKFFTKYNFQYDKKLLFYGTDNYFMFSYRKVEEELNILNCTLNHSLSIYENPDDIDNILNRYSQIITANRIIFRENFLILFLLELYTLLKSIQLVIHHKSFKFLKLNLH